jgi:hypothetical protein
VDSTQFDRMTKDWAVGTSRRWVLRVLLGGALSALLTTLGFQRGAAAACDADSDCNDSRSCTENKCVNRSCTYPPKPEGVACPEGGNPCTADVCDGAGHCVHLPKADGESCGADRVCSQLHCCPVTRPTFCSETGSCTNLKTDESNCGSCGHQCPGSRVCRRGSCRRR